MVNIRISHFSSLNGVKSILQTKPQVIEGVNISTFQYMPRTKHKPKSSFFITLKTIYSALKTVKQNLNELGVSAFDAVKSAKNGVPCAPGAVFGKLKDKKLIANIPIQNRADKKFISASLTKLDFSDDLFVYVLKKGKKQLGYIEVLKNDGNEMYIEFMTTYLGRNKYRNLENKMIQGVVEDCINQGFVPKIKACAVDIADGMGRGYNNRALYERMGAVKNNEGFFEVMPKNVAAILKKHIKRNGEILSGSLNALEKLGI